MTMKLNTAALLLASLAACATPVGKTTPECPALPNVARSVGGNIHSAVEAALAGDEIAEEVTDVAPEIARNMGDLKRECEGLLPLLNVAPDASDAIVNWGNLFNSLKELVGFVMPYNHIPAKMGTLFGKIPARGTAAVTDMSEACNNFVMVQIPKPGVYEIFLTIVDADKDKNIFHDSRVVVRLTEFKGKNMISLHDEKGYWHNLPPVAYVVIDGKGNVVDSNHSGDIMPNLQVVWGRSLEDGTWPNLVDPSRQW